MTRKEHLLVKLMEESSEIVKAVSKVLLFGLEDGYPELDTTNEEDINNEFNDLLAVVQMLNSEGLNIYSDNTKISAKKVKVEQWILYAKQRKIL